MAASSNGHADGRSEQPTLPGDNPFSGQHGEDEELDLTRIRTAYGEQSNADGDGEPLGDSPSASRTQSTVSPTQAIRTADPFAGAESTTTVNPSRLRAVSEAHEDKYEAGPSNERPSEAAEGVTTPAVGDYSIDTGRLRAISDLHSRQQDEGPGGESPIGSGAQVENAYGEEARSSDHSSASLVRLPTVHENEKSASGENLNAPANTLDKIKSATHDAEQAMREKMKDLGNRFHLDSIKATGPSRLFNPTNIRMRVRFDEQPDESNIQKSKEVALLWRSRDNRKGRNSIAVPLDPAIDPTTRPRPTSHIVEILKNIWRMLTVFAYWDMAWWSGWSYSIGSALFVLDGAFSWAPAAYPDSEFPGETKYVGPLCFFIGAMFYQVGAVMAYLEAVNDGSFHGSAMRRLLEGHHADQKQMLDEKIHAFFDNMNPRNWHHKTDEEMQAEDFAAMVDPHAGWRTKDNHLRPGSIYPVGKRPASRRGGLDLGGEEGDESTYTTWRWWPSWETLKTHHVYEIGYVACTIQLFGVTLYGVTAVVVLPGVLSSLAPWQKLGAFWVPQIVAALCFLIASLMFMFETQEKWWKPELKVLGWWIGFWSVVGSVGFELIAIFGWMALVNEEAYPWAEAQADLATIWGSGAYLFGSVLQWYESLNKNPVEELFNEPGEMKSSRVRV